MIMRKSLSCGLIGALFWLPWAVNLAATVHHDIELQLDPATGGITVTDRMRLPRAVRDEPVFSLAAGLQPVPENGRLEVQSASAHGRTIRYRYRGTADADTLTLHYAGSLKGLGERRGHGMPVGMVSDAGVYLDGAAGWYPAFAGHMQSYSLRLRLPAGWHGMSAGTRSLEDGATVWDAPMPQDDILLVAGPYARYQCRTPTTLIEVLLLKPDAPLAQRYLNASGRYVTLYEQLLGAYPYDHFAVVENPWQTGYGMPSFTLLGSRVLRLPFLVDSSLPHEIVHNWWGNGVFLAADGGNWSEGLTAYLADHLIKEMVGQGADYRRRALERYANFAATGRDFPLRAFRARHDDASQAVGYSKSMMLFHMIRRELGDAAFIAALRDFYRDYRFRRASIDDLLGVFARHGLPDPDAFRHNWLDRLGAPTLALARAQVDGHHLSLHLQQTQAGAVYPMTVPVAVTLAGEQSARWMEVPMTGRETEVQWTFASRPLRVDVDPAFDLFRQLLPAERPNSLGRLFGSDEQLLVLPAKASPGEQAAWRELAQQWQRRYRNVRVIYDDAIDRLPEDAAVWLLGWDNRFVRESVARFTSAGQGLLADGAMVGDQLIDPQQQAVVMLDPDNGRPALGFIGARGAQAISLLARKLTHYAGFGRLVFDLPGVSNRLREGLVVVHSPLSRTFTDSPPNLRLPGRSALDAQLAPDNAWREAGCH